MCRSAYIPYFKMNTPIFCWFIFFKECFSTQVRVNKMVNKHTVNYHSGPSVFTSRIHPLIFLWAPSGFISPEYFLNFFSNLYIPPWLQKKFQIHGVKITRKYICESKNLIWLLMHPNSLGFAITTLGRRKLPIFANKVFLKSIFPQQRGGRLRSISSTIRHIKTFISTFFFLF